MGLIARSKVPRRLESGTLPVTRRARVLVVDDEPTIVEATCLVLSDRHDTTAMTSAPQVLTAIALGQRFDLILCDLLMPEMTGMQLHAELLRIAPEQATRMVFMTGAMFPGEARSFLSTTTNPTLEKPFLAEELVDTLDEALVGLRS